MPIGDYKNTAWNVSKYGVISGPYFPVFGVNTATYSVNRRIQFKYRKMQTRNNFVFDRFSRSVYNSYTLCRTSLSFFDFWNYAIVVNFLVLRHLDSLLIVRYVLSHFISWHSQSIFIHLLLTRGSAEILPSK